MFLPVTQQEMFEREIWQADFIMISGDAYVDHPSFGNALIARLIESQGFSVAMIPQPVADSDYKKCGEPKKAFLVSPGVVDSMVNNYSVSLNKRNEDVYSEDGKAGKRPDRALITYVKALKRLFPNVPVIAGGIEASLRRLSHYDYWSDSVMHSILYDSGADLIIYGMGENPIFDLCKAANKGIPMSAIRDIRGTAYLTTVSDASKSIKSVIESNGSDDFIVVSSHERVKTDKKLYCKAFMAAYENTDPFTGKGIIQKQDNFLYAVINKPCFPLDEKTMDFVYALPYERKIHPMYNSVPAIEEVEFSVTAHRGCFGNCNFCALTYHQGKIIQARSENSIVAEVETLSKLPNFKGYIHDIGGPSANFHQPACDKQTTKGVCPDRECIGFKACPNLKVSHEKYLNILRRARSIKGIKKVFIRSGVRYDYLMMDKDRSFFNELVEHHISGQLKVAPEHCSDVVLSKMNKPQFMRYKEFYSEFYKVNAKCGKEQFLVPYFISSHPGSSINDAIELTLYLKSIGYMPRQVQDFYPTPGTLSTAMYYTELNPIDLSAVYVAKTPQDKAMQRALLQYRLPVNRILIEKALKIAGREDLVFSILGTNDVKINVQEGNTAISTFAKPKPFEKKSGLAAASKPKPFENNSGLSAGLKPKPFEKKSGLAITSKPKPQVSKSGMPAATKPSANEQSKNDKNQHNKSKFINKNKRQK